MRKIAYVLIGYVFLSSTVVAQCSSSEPRKVQFGIEQDVLPYILKGKFASGWLGVDNVRLRASYAIAHTPQLMLSTGITYDIVKAAGVSIEWFKRNNFEGPWAGVGLGYWENSLKAEDWGTKLNSSIIFSIGGGVNKTIYKGLYWTPWVALHTRMTNSKLIQVGHYNHKPMLLTPELSVKLGFRF